MHTIKITPNLQFECQCTSGKFIRLPNRIESKLFCPNWNALLEVSTPDCDAGGSRFVYHRGRLCLALMPLWYAVLGTGCAHLLQCLGQLNLASFGVAKSSTSFGWGKVGDVTSAGWQVTLCDPV